MGASGPVPRPLWAVRRLSSFWAGAGATVLGAGIGL